MQDSSDIRFKGVPISLNVAAKVCTDSESYDGFRIDHNGDSYDASKIDELIESL